MCGMDRDTHISECAAKSRGVLVDYWGPCKAVGAPDSKLLHDKDNTLLVLITTLMHSLASYLVV